MSAMEKMPTYKNTQHREEEAEHRPERETSHGSGDEAERITELAARLLFRIDEADVATECCHRNPGT